MQAARLCINIFYKSHCRDEKEGEEVFCILGIINEH